MRRLPDLIPIFPVRPFVPGSICAHRRRIRAGSLIVCMICHQCGIDGHPALRRDPATDPRREPVPKPAVAPLAKLVLNRRQKRLLRFGAPFTPAAAATLAFAEAH